ncbi:exported hypothetical protein [Paraburkholderia ribeironis]|uniref:Uncharacterized protein n=1 Tax=Paraburkholderia ribeironis TaxID=1247936 RepID=A0A1N7S601_9BURK|nr:exported hypothetical protein [Paraburkholderia ribeironis]
MAITIAAIIGMTTGITVGMTAVRIAMTATWVTMIGATTAADGTVDRSADARQPSALSAQASPSPSGGVG